MTAELIALRESQLAIEGEVAEFSHQNSRSRNALTLELRQDYAEMLDQVQARRDIRALIITGSAGSFCAGGDLKSLQQRSRDNDPETRSPDAMRRRLQDVHRWMQRLRDLEIPVIAAVDGPAYGAGFAIALAADFVLASSRASFCLSFLKVGLVPDAGSAYLLPRVLGLQKAKELLFTARRVGVEEASALGIVHAVHAPEALAEEARRFAGRFVDAPREVLGMTKGLLNRSFETPYATLAELECSAQGIATAQPYHQAAVETFLRGEPARYDWDRERR